MATGMAAVGFGAGAPVTGPVADELVPSPSIPIDR
jgi:hypothetical protein